MGSSISKQKNNLRYKVTKINLNRAIKKYNKKYDKNISYYNPKYKKNQKIIKKKRYKFTPEMVNIKYINSQMENLSPNLKYSYVYKGVPGGWYYDIN
jgi:hypothetical protein